MSGFSSHTLTERRPTMAAKKASKGTKAAKPRKLRDLSPRKAAGSRIRGGYIEQDNLYKRLPTK
jgi:hypothetical protein